MEERIRPWVLWPRAAVVGLLVTGLGVIAHAHAGGSLPSGPALAFLALAAVVASAPLLLRRASRTRLVALVGGGQVAVHLALTAIAQGHATSGGLVPGPAHAGHGAHGDAGSAGAATVLDLLAAHVLTHPLMLLTHAAAAAVVGLWLAHGERLLWSLVGLAAHRARRWWRSTSVALGGGAALPDLRVPTPGHQLATPASLRASRAVMRRGPPVVVA